ncbi:hypothetical protein ACFW04_008870 [Cataglyphis niger]
MSVNVLESIKKAYQTENCSRISDSSHPRDSHHRSGLRLRGDCQLPEERKGIASRTGVKRGWFRPEGGWLEQRGTTAPPSGTRAGTIIYFWPRLVEGNTLAVAGTH